MNEFWFVYLTNTTKSTYGVGIAEGFNVCFKAESKPIPYLVEDNVPPLLPYTLIFSANGFVKSLFTWPVNILVEVLALISNNTGFELPNIPGKLPPPNT